MNRQELKRETNLLLNALPAKADRDDLIYHIYVRKKIDAGLRDSAAGGVVTSKSYPESTDDCAVTTDPLSAESFSQPDPKIDTEWRSETRPRVAEIQSGQVEGIPGEQVVAELRRAVGL